MMALAPGCFPQSFSDTCCKKPQTKASLMEGVLSTPISAKPPQLEWTYQSHGRLSQKLPPRHMGPKICQSHGEAWMMV